MSRISYRSLIAVLLLALPLAAACRPQPAPAPTATRGPEKLIFRNWEGNISPEIMQLFTDQTGIRVEMQPYESQELAIADLQAGKPADVVVLENQLIPPLIQTGLLAEIRLTNLPNFKNISANFRDLAYDPGNAHSIPYSWGTTGLVFRSDLPGSQIRRWADLWDPAYRGRLLGWTLPRYMLGITLKSLGYSLNSEKPQELEQAAARLIELKPAIRLVDWETAAAAPGLVSGEVWAAVGQADDVIAAREQGARVDYILPEEGGLLWGDNFTIPAASPNQAAAEALINFLLSPEIAARIINETFYWLPNDAALPLVEPQIRDNPAIFPTAQGIKNSEILLPLSPQGEALYQSAWERFLAAP
ncbi:MAG: PotD/PotF family extracellular solute-binding protein [Chloroflexota bacterium]